MKTVIWSMAFGVTLLNISSCVYRIFYHFLKGKTRSQDVFIFSLSMSDLIIGLYLFIIASVDIFYEGFFFQIRLSWLSSSLCKAGALLSTTSMETSVLTLLFITIERAYIVVKPFKKFLFKTHQAVSICILSYIVLVGLVSLFVFNTDIDNSICLVLNPSSHKQTMDHIHLLVVSSNILILSISTVAYIIMIWKLQSTRKHSGRKADTREFVLALKLFLILAFNFT